MTIQPLPASSWLNAPAHHAWLAAEGQRLLAFAKASRLPEGFGNEETSVQTGATFREALTGYPVGSQVVVIEPGDGQPRVSVVDILAVV